MLPNDFNSPLSKRCPLIHVPRFSDDRGSLSVWEMVSELAFLVKRVFWFYDVPASANRGGHAHRTCKELVFAVSGSFEVELTDGISKMNVRLEDPSVGLVIPEYIWCRLHHFSENAVGLCLASESYAPDGYFHDFEQYLKETTRLKTNE